jgi:hypothetical protein
MKRSKKKPRVTITKDYLDQLKAEARGSKVRIEALDADLKRHRDFYVRLLRKSMELLARGNGYNTSILVEELAQHFTNVGKWYWR